MPSLPPPAGGGERRHALALGIERLGIVSLRFPRTVALLTILLAIAASIGISRLQIEDSLSDLFRSETPAFKQYEDVTKRFPSTEFDVLAVIEGDNLLARDSIEKLRELAEDLQLIEGTRGLISIFSARQPPENGEMPAPLFPGQLPEGVAYQRLIHRVTNNAILRGKLLSENGRLTLMVLALEPSAAKSSQLSGIITQIRKAAKEDLAGAGLVFELTGVPVMQNEIRNAVERDRLIYNTAGFVAGCAIAIIFFRRISFMIVAAGPPLTAILLALGALGWLGFRLNMFLNVMTPLVMVISFSDTMQLTFATRDRLLEGEKRADALRYAIRVVGPACVLTHATAALSFVALQFSASDLIRTFGQAGLVAILIALVSVLILMPLLGLLFLRDEAGIAAKVAGADLGLKALRHFCAWVAARMVSRAGLYSILSLAAVAGLGFVYSGLEPRYRLADQVPNKQASSASHRLDIQLTGANPVDVLVEFPPGVSLYDPQTLAVIAKVHSIVEHQPGIGNVWSLETLRRWLIKAGMPSIGTLKQYADMLPAYLTRRFISANQDAALVTGRVPDADASKLLPIVQALEDSLSTVEAENPGYRISVTGLSVIAARSSASMIEKLSLGLTFEFLLVAIFIGAAFRSFLVMFVVILPGVFPILAAGAILRATGQGLQFASVVALTVSFGLGLSATIHFLNRLRLEDDPADDPGVAVERATVLVGPAVILTSIVLACGLAVTVFSDLPSLRLFGWLSAFAMLAAVVADLFILRPTAMFLRRLARRRPQTS
ncbi:MAG: MMPL family transporter [Methylocapsa sp.]|nr:MMPL family transporter [Methylocapsa sp.]